jgi:hypothetical protein
LKNKDYTGPKNLTGKLSLRGRSLRDLKNKDNLIELLKPSFLSGTPLLTVELNPLNYCPPPETSA